MVGTASGVPRGSRSRSRGAAQGDEGPARDEARVKDAVALLGRVPQHRLHETDRPGCGMILVPPRDCELEHRGLVVAAAPALSGPPALTE